jgi:NitT/TauT family transport system substrate-binding protein
MVLTVLFWCIALQAARAEVKEVRFATQYGIPYLPISIVEKNKLIEKHAKLTGLGDIKVTWRTFAGGAALNEALLSKSVDFVAGGVAPMIRLWAKTRGNFDVKGVTAIASPTIYLTSSNPKVRTIRDFTEKDRIALPAAKISNQAIILQMAAAKTFGDSHYDKLDHLTVTMASPDAMAAMLSGKSEITAHFSNPPFQYQELESPNIHLVLNSFDVLGEPVTLALVWTAGSFYEANPKTYAAITAAIEEAVDLIKKDKRRAAEIYIEASKTKEPVDKIIGMLNDPQMLFTTTPQNTLKFADFMYKTGAIKVKPDTWKDLFFPNMHNLKGS